MAALSFNFHFQFLKELVFMGLDLLGKVLVQISTFIKGGTEKKRKETPKRERN